MNSDTITSKTTAYNNFVYQLLLDKNLKTKFDHYSDKPKSVEQLLALTAINVLGSMEPYTSGQQQLSDKKISKIQKEFTKKVDHLNHKYENLRLSMDKRVKTFVKMSNKLREMSNELKDKEKASSKLEDIFLDFYQLCGCNISYRNWKIGDIIPGPVVGEPDYKVHHIIKNKNKLHIVILVPTKKNDLFPPILCCRGTTHRSHNFLDDVSKHIGKLSLSGSEKEVLDSLNAVTKEHGPAVITGHSLGGAISGQITVEYCDQTNDNGIPLIKANYHFASPGVGEESAQKYNEKCKKLAVKPKVVRVYHFYDPTPHAGGSQLAYNQQIRIGGRWDFKYVFKMLTESLTSFKQVHSWKYLITDYHMEEHTPTWKTGCLAFIIESLRRILGYFPKKLLQHSIERHHKNKEMAREFVKSFKGLDKQAV